MTSISVDIVDTGATDGGHTAFRISGARSLPADPVFRIDPINDVLTDVGEIDWPSGPRRPLSVVHHEGAVDLVLGPDVLESPLLLPGTPVVFSIANTAIVKEFLWPSIPTRHRHRRYAAFNVADGGGGHRAPSTGEATRAQPYSRSWAGAAAGAAASAAAAGAGATAAFRPSGRLEAPPQSQLTGEDDLPLDDPFSWEGEETPSEREEASANPFGYTLPAIGSGRGLTLPSPDYSGASHAEAPALPVKATSTALATIADNRHPGVGIIRQTGAFVGGMIAAAALVLGLVQQQLLQWQPAPAMSSAPTPDAALSSARSASTLRAILVTGDTSPRGASAVGIDGVQALALADKYLHGADNAPRDQGEASFWLRHALSRPIDQDGMRWALTQLGSIFATPEGFEPDFAKARTLWEVAGSLGDPVALCFNASLYEHGLGVPKHKDLARALYERARSSGGCNGVEDAIARTK